MDYLSLIGRDTALFENDIDRRHDELSVLSYRALLIKATVSCNKVYPHAILRVPTKNDTLRMF